MGWFDYLSESNSKKPVYEFPMYNLSADEIPESLRDHPSFAHTIKRDEQKKEKEKAKIKPRGRNGLSA